MDEELREKIARRFAIGSNDVCNSCGNPVNRDNPDDVAKDVLALIEEAGFVQLAEDQSLPHKPEYCIVDPCPIDEFMRKRCSK